MRNAIGIAAPLAVGEVRGDITAGLAATIGALQTAFADRPGPYRLRIVRMLGTALAAGVTSGLAVVASRSDAASVALLFVLAFAAGLLLAGGPSATQVGVAGVGAALVLGHIAAGARRRASRGAARAGRRRGARPCWRSPPGRCGRHRPERVALAGLYRELAAAARVPPGTAAGPPASDTLSEVRSTLYGLGHDNGPSVEAYRVLLDEAERIRREVIVVIGFAERLAAEGDPIRAGLVREALAAAAAVLEALASALETGRPVDEATLEPTRQAVAFALSRLEDDAPGPHQLTRRAAGGAAARAQRPAARGGALQPSRRERGSAESTRCPGRATLHDSLANLTREPHPGLRGAAPRRAGRRVRRRHRPRRASGRPRTGLLGLADRPGRAASGLRRDPAARGAARRSAR